MTRTLRATGFRGKVRPFDDIHWHEVIAAKRAVRLLLQVPSTASLPPPSCPRTARQGPCPQFDARSGSVTSVVFIGLIVELILQVGSGAGFAMVFALLVAAILWSLGTWWLRLPAQVKGREFNETRQGKAPSPRWNRGLLVLTCTGVSFAHGSNEGQKGVIPIM